MARKRQRPHFSDLELDISERLQALLKRTDVVGKRAVKAVTGSSSEAYVQLDWCSQKIKSDMTHTVEVSGDPDAGFLAKNWGTAALLAINRERLQRLKDIHKGHVEALAYVSDKKVHVGTMAIEGVLLQGYNEGEDAVAVRRGRGLVQYAIGLWLPPEQIFISSAGIRVAHENVPIDSIAQEYPGVRLG